jgi:4-oxalocrotonate tautomerase
MPLVDIQLIEGVFSADEKRRMIENVTEAMVQIEGEAVGGVTWVRIQEFASGAWGIAGKGLTTDDVKALRSTPRGFESSCHSGARTADQPGHRESGQGSKVHGQS